MPAWLGPVIQGIGAVGGAILGNRANRQSARDSMRFAERMSSTAAQRSARDYAAAGLNPALAYDRPASSPGGTMAPQEDVVGKGISSGMAARAQQAQLALLAAQTEKTQGEADLVQSEVSLRYGREANEPSWREEQIAARVARLRDMAHQGRLQPHDERLRQLAKLMAEAGYKRGQFVGSMFGDAGAVADFIRTGLSSSRDAAEAFRAMLQSQRDVDRQQVEGIRRKYFNPQHPRAKAGRRP